MNPLLEKLKSIELDDKKMLAVALGLILFLYVDISFVMKAQGNAIKNLNPKISKLKTDLNNFNRDYAAMAKSPAKGVQEKKPGIKKKMVEESDIASLLQDISDIANKNEIKITQLRPNKENPGPKDKLPGIEKLIPMTIALDMTGDYHKVGKFISELEYGANFISVQEMRISAQAGDLFKQKVSLVLKTYVKK